MRATVALTLALIVAGCGAGTDSTGPEAQPVPDGDAHGMSTGSPMGSMMSDFNTEIKIEAGIAETWMGIKVQVVDSESGEAQIFDVSLGESVILGDSGLTLSADSFVPDFAMDESGITSRSAETHNPAARVVISEAGMADYQGWLFAAMPEIHPFPHDRYQVLLVEGIPAE